MTSMASHCHIDLFDEPILSPINLFSHFENIRLQKMTHIISR